MEVDGERIFQSARKSTDLYMRPGNDESTSRKWIDDLEEKT